MLKKIKTYQKIVYQIVRIGIIRKSQFRVEFLAQVLMDICWYLSHILIFEILYLHTDSIAGWGRDETRVFLGFIFVSDAFMMTWMGQFWLFPEELKDGKLDPFRVKPGSTIFLYFFQRFSPEGLTNMLCALGYLAFAISRTVPLENLVNWFVLGWAILVCWWARIILLVFFSTIEFYILNSDLSRFVEDICTSAEDRPLDIFSKRLKWFLIFMVPVGSMSYIPACMLLGKLDVTYSFGVTLWLLFFGFCVFRFWNYSFHRYESAMG